MKNLLGTKVGHAALLTMCNILNDPVSHKDEALLRGAVFYINMGLWGTTGSVVPMLKNSPSPVLMSFLRVLHCQRLIVTYEVILGIQRLISMSGKELSEPSWDLLCDILKAIADNISYYGKVYFVIVIYTNYRQLIVLCFNREKQHTTTRSHNSECVPGDHHQN